MARNPDETIELSEEEEEMLDIEFEHVEKIRLNASEGIMIITEEDARASMLEPAETVVKGDVPEKAKENIRSTESILGGVVGMEFGGFGEEASVPTSAAKEIKITGKWMHVKFKARTSRLYPRVEFEKTGVVRDEDGKRIREEEVRAVVTLKDE